VIPSTKWGTVTEADLELVRWIEDNISPEQGQIGLAAMVFEAGRDNQEKHIYALGGAQAMVLYGPHLNFRFGLPQLEPYGFRIYNRRIKKDLDVKWCLDRNIRYFYVPGNSLGQGQNRGLARAIENGSLRPIHRVGDSCLYELVWPPP